MPGAIGYVCQLDPQHEGWHRTGPVRWGGGSEVADGKHDDETGDY
jgi:hypothetical protein